MTMRVLHVITSGHRRGGDVFASDLVAALQGTDLEQRVATLRAPEGEAVPFEAPVHILGSRRRMLPGLNIDLQAVGKLSGLIGRWGPDVIQAHGGEPYKYAAAANLRHRSALVYRRIGAAPAWIKKGHRRLAHGSLMRHADRIVAVADAVRDETIDLFRVDPSKILTIPNGVDPRRIETARTREEVRRELAIPSHAVVVLSLGAFTWEKDPLTQLQVSANVIRHEPDVIHLFVGDGPMKPEVERRITETALTRSCRVLGSRSLVGDILAAADVFLFTSRLDGMEGMPATVIEAGMAGLPVVAYSVVGVPEVVHHETTGLLAPHGDVERLSEYVRRLAVDRGLRSMMGRSAKEFCRQQFSIDQVAAEYQAVYGNLIGKASATDGSEDRRAGERSITPQTANGSPDPFFIVGAQRSGTTLLKLMVDRHSLVGIPPEAAGLIPDLCQRGARYGTSGRVIKREVFLRDVASHPAFRRWDVSVGLVREELERFADPTLQQAISAIYSAYARKHGKAGWGDKTPRYIEEMSFLARLFPTARFAHLIRDGRDVALSELELHRLHRHSASVALTWRRKITRARATGIDLGDRYIEVRYEDLIAAPEMELRRLCRFLKLPFEPKMLSHDADQVKQTLERMPATARVQHQRLLNPPTKGLRDWRAEMSCPEIVEFEAIAGRVLREAAYPLSGGKITVMARVRAWAHVAAFLVRSLVPRARLRRQEKRRWRDELVSTARTAA